MQASKAIESRFQRYANFTEVFFFPISRIDATFCSQSQSGRGCSSVSSSTGMVAFFSIFWNLRVLSFFFF